MSHILAQAQMAAQEELLKIDALVVDLSMRFSALGLKGSEVHAGMHAALVQHPSLVNMITFDKWGVVISAEPMPFHFMEGLELSASKNVAQMLAKKMPVMSDVFQPKSGPSGAAISAPVFDDNGRFIGAVSSLCSVPALMNDVLPRLSTGTGFTFTILQLDGEILYDTDAAQIGMNVVHGPDFAAFPQTQALAARVVKESTGRGTHSYFVDTADQQVVEKECYWTTIGAHGIVWRLAIERCV